MITHLGKGKTRRIFDDLDIASVDKIEIEADDLAREGLIPGKVWDDSLARFIHSEELVTKLASDLEISPAIIAGRIRFDVNNFIIFNDLVGQGEVRKHFPEIYFGY